MTRAKNPAPEPLGDPSLIDRAEKIVGHRFADPSLLRIALTHPSVMSNASADADAIYERMEFLGDSILNFLIADEAYRRFPDMREGGMTRIRVHLITGTVQSRIAREMGLADVLVVGQSERGTGGRGINKALENAYEAITAAIYLDAGLDAAREWMLRTVGPLIAPEVAEEPENPKSQLQEITQAKGDTPVYVSLGHTGPPHERTFMAVVEVGGKKLGEGSGHSKKEAEAAAASAALKQLRTRSKRRRS